MKCFYFWSKVFYLITGLMMGTSFLQPQRIFLEVLNFSLLEEQQDYIYLSPYYSFTFLQSEAILLFLRQVLDQETLWCYSQQMNSYQAFNSIKLGFGFKLNLSPQDLVFSFISYFSNPVRCFLLIFPQHYVICFIVCNGSDQSQLLYDRY